MLDEFILANVDELAARTRARSRQRGEPHPEVEAHDGGVATLLVQLAARLQMRPGQAGALPSAAPSIDELATARALELLNRRLPIEHAVLGYSDIFQAVTDLISERDERVSAAQMRDFGACLAQLVAAAVRAFSRSREERFAAAELVRVGELAHELRNVIATASLSFEAIKAGSVGTNASLAAMHTRSLARLRVLVDQALTQVRIEADVTQLRPVAVRALVEDAAAAAQLHANAMGLRLIVESGDDRLAVSIDQPALASALANLLLNAFKFTRPKGDVSIHARSTSTRALIDVQDECGGLKVANPEELFKPFEQHNDDRSGLGLGLQIARRAVEANGGTLRAVDLAPLGCRFTVDLPRL